MSQLHPATLRDAMRRMPFLSRFSDAALDGLGAMLLAKRYDVDQAVYKEGQPGDSMLMVVSGRLSVRVRSAALEDVEVAAVYPGEVVGEGACVDPGPRSATVVATKGTQVLELSRATLKTLIDSAPEVAVAVVGATIQLLAKRIRDTNSRMEAEMSRRGVATASRAGAVPTPTMPLTPGADEGRVDLRAVACLQGFSNPELQALVKVAPPLRYADATTLCREGESGDSCFILARGSVAILRQIGGMERTMATLDTGALVGQMALIDRSPRSATVRTRGDAIVLTLHQRAFDQLLNAAHPFAVKFQEQIAVAGVKQLRMANQRFAGILDRPQVVTPRPGSGIELVGRAAVAKPPARPSPSGLLDERGPAGGRRPRGGDMGEVLTYMQTALGEWNMSLEDLENVSFEKPELEPTRPRRGTYLQYRSVKPKACSTPARSRSRARSRFGGAKPPRRHPK